MDHSGYQPSGWMQEAFGVDCAAVAAALARSAQTAQSDSTDAKTGSRLRTNEAYGATFWLALAKETAAELEDIGAETVHPKGNRYRLAVVNGVLVLAIKLPAASRGVEYLRVESGIRQRILKLSSSLGPAIPTLDFGPDFELVDSEGQPVVEDEFGSAVRAVLVVVEGTAQTGVDRIHIGDVRLADRNQVVWLHREELPAHIVSNVVAGLVALEPEPTTSFSDAVIPTAAIDFVTNDGIAENDEAIVDSSEVWQDRNRGGGR